MPISSKSLFAAFSDIRLRVFGLLAILSLLWACYPVSETSYSSPQSSINQWMIEFQAGDAKAHLSLRVSQQRNGGYSENNTEFGVTLDQLVGLSREQIMSSGTNVRFQLKRDAGTFNCEGWFKEGN